MTSTYDLGLVALLLTISVLLPLSIVIAVIASYTALDLWLGRSRQLLNRSVSSEQLAVPLPWGLGGSHTALHRNARL